MNTNKECQAASFGAVVQASGAGARIVRWFENNDSTVRIDRCVRDFSRSGRVGDIAARCVEHLTAGGSGCDVLLHELGALGKAATGSAPHGPGGVSASRPDGHRVGCARDSGGYRVAAPADCACCRSVSGVVADGAFPGECSRGARAYDDRRATGDYAGNSCRCAGDFHRRFGGCRVVKD